MKKLFVLSFLVLAFCYNSFATLRNIPLDELVKDSDLIVVGTLHSVSEYSLGGENNGEGKILVEQIIAGNVKTNEDLLLKPGDKLSLIWIEDFACVYGIHRRTENEKGVWFLKIGKGGTVTAGHPQRFKSPDELNEIRNALEKFPASESSSKHAKIVDVSGQTYSNFNAFLVILGSCFLYYFLYRSRFKIR